jgi:hypothetical protein
VPFSFLETTMNPNTLTNALPIVASAYGRKFGVSVQVGGDQAATDGKTIRIPSIDDTPISKTLAWGYLAHEAGHVRHTDFSVWNEVAGHPLTKAITNILEDVRIESAMIGSYPGARQTLDAVLDWMIGEGKIEAPTIDQNPPAVLANALLVLARHRYRKQETLVGLARSAEQGLRQVFPTSFVHRLIGLMTEIPSLRTTLDSVELARKIVALIEEEAQEDVDQSASREEQRAEKDDQTSTLDAPSSDLTGTKTGEAEDQGTESVEHGAKNLAPCTGTQALQAVLSAGPDDLPEDLFKTVAEALGGSGNGRSTTVLPTLEEYAGNAQHGRTALNRVKVHSAKLTARLQGLVQAHTLTKCRTARRGRTLSPTHLHRVAVGDSRVFVRREQKIAPNTALHLLVDLSGSMCGGQDSIALDAAMALALALEPISGVSRAVTAFPSLQGRDDQVTRLLSHGDHASGRAGAFVQRGRGSTPMTGALWFAAADLLSRNEERKVILALTDGDPDDWTSAKDLVERAVVAGIELIGVGIQHDVRRLFPVAIQIQSIEDLKEELFRIAERMLLR